MSARVEILEGDCLVSLAALPENSIDSCVTDPPYHLTSIVKRFGGKDAPPAKDRDGAFARQSKGFMGKQWDGGDVAFRVETWRQVYRVLKPGAFLVAFSATRTYHRMVCAIEDAGFVIRDQLDWLYGSGFPKSHNIAKAIDKALGVKPTIIGREFLANDIRGAGLLDAAHGERPGFERDITVATSPEAQEWDGWGAALKPAHEPIVLAQKPISEGSIARNVMRWGVGGLNIAACRVGEEGGTAHAPDVTPGAEQVNAFRASLNTESFGRPVPGLGRWPANVLHDGSDDVEREFAAFAAPGAQGIVSGREPSASTSNTFGEYAQRAQSLPRGDVGSPSRFFYSAKADETDRLGSKHPTVKPVDLMAWLVKLTTPKGGVTLDPFAGTGTTGMAALREGRRAILCEREPEYIADIKRRLDHVEGADTPLFSGEPANDNADQGGGRRVYQPFARDPPNRRKAERSAR